MPSKLVIPLTEYANDMDAIRSFVNVGTVTNAPTTPNIANAYVLFVAVQDCVIDYIDIIHDGVSAGSAGGMDCVAWKFPAGTALAAAGTGATQIGATLNLAASASAGRSGFTLTGSTQATRTLTRGDTLVVVVNSVTAGDAGDITQLRLAMLARAKKL